MNCPVIRTSALSGTRCENPDRMKEEGRERGEAVGRGA